MINSGLRRKQDFQLLWSSIFASSTNNAVYEGLSHIYIYIYTHIHIQVV